VLASDEDGSTPQVLKFSNASDIVELVVLTTDEVFLRTLRDAVGGARHLWHVASADKISDLLVSGDRGSRCTGFAVSGSGLRRTDQAAISRSGGGGRRAARR
jgi:hypothetical protein